MIVNRLLSFRSVIRGMVYLRKFRHIFLSLSTPQSSWGEVLDLDSRPSWASPSALEVGSKCEVNRIMVQLFGYTYPGQNSQLRRLHPQLICHLAVAQKPYCSQKTSLA